MFVGRSRNLKEITLDFLKLFSFFFYTLMKLARFLENEYLVKVYFKKYNIDPTAKFVGLPNKLDGDGEIYIGAKSHIDGNVWLSSSSGSKIIIGRECRIGRNVTMLTSNTIPDQDFSETLIRDNGDIVIGDHVWIGVNVFIKQGISIGNNVVIGANSVVTKSVPDGHKYLGTKIVKKSLS